MSNIIRIRRGDFADLPAGGTRQGEPRFALDTGQLFIDDGAVNKEISYSDAKARAVQSPISIAPPAFQPRHDTYDWSITQYSLSNRAALTAQEFSSRVLFPPGVTITKVTLYGYRDDALSSMILYLMRINRAGGQSGMATITANWITGVNSLFDDSIGFEVIDNVNYSYALALTIDPNNNVTDVAFYGAKIDFTG